MLEAVIGRYGQALLRYCHHILCDYHEAQDAVQDALLRAWSRRNRFRAGTNLEAWLYKLAYHACIDLLRQRRRQLFAPPPPSGHNPDYIGPELRAALSVLTPEERGLVFGRVMEAAPMRSCPRSTARPPPPCASDTSGRGRSWPWH